MLVFLLNCHRRCRFVCLFFFKDKKVTKSPMKGASNNTSRYQFYELNSNFNSKEPHDQHLKPSFIISSGDEAHLRDEANLSIFKMHLKFHYIIIKRIILIWNIDLTETSLSLNRISFFTSFIRPNNLAGEGGREITLP